MTPCAHIDCPNEGTRRPVLLVLPADMPDYAGDPTRLVMGLLVCDEHQSTMRAADHIGDEGWARIVETFERIGRATPDRATVGLAWQLPEMGPGGVLS